MSAAEGPSTVRSPLAAFFIGVAAYLVTARLISGAVLFGVVGTGLLAWELIATFRTQGRRERTDPIEARRQRVQALTRRLRESANEWADLLAELQADIGSGMTRAEEIREQIERNARLASLSQEQREAVGTIFAEQLGESDRRGLRQELWLGLAFFAEAPDRRRARTLSSRRWGSSQSASTR